MFIMSASKIQFRQFRSSDLPAVKNVHELALKAIDMYSTGHWNDDLDDIAKNYLDSGGDFVVGTLDGHIVAIGAFKKLSASTAEVKRMRVLPEFQGQGIGKMLLKYLEEEIKNHGYREIELHTTINQQAAQKLYEDNEYREFKRETKGWPFEVIFYKKDLQAS